MLVDATELINEFLEIIKQEMLDYLDGEDRNATGRTRASIQITNPSPTVGNIIGANHIEYTFRGRGPGGFPPLSAIIDWCNARGIPRGMAWIIAKNIAEAGTKLHQSGVNVLNEILTEEKIERFKTSILAVYVAKIQSDIDILATAR